MIKLTEELIKKAKVGDRMTIHNAYCYSSDCPVRTKKEPWPRSNAVLKWVKRISKKGNEYRRKVWVCEHCGYKMQFTFSMFDEDYS